MNTKVIAPMARCVLCGETAVFNVTLGPYSLIESTRWSRPTASPSRHVWLCDKHFEPYRPLWRHIVNEAAS